MTKIYTNHPRPKNTSQTISASSTNIFKTATGQLASSNATNNVIPGSSEGTSSYTGNPYPLIVCAIIVLCFLYTGAGYLSWMYHLIDFYPATNVDVLTEVIGYLFQALGIFIFSFTIKNANRLTNRNTLYTTASLITTPIGNIAILIIDLALIIAACLSPNAALTLIFGYLMNITHGLVAGVYLTLLVTHVTQQKRALVFAIGYAAGTVLSHLLSTIGNDNFLRDNRVLIIYAIITLLAIIILYHFYAHSLQVNMPNMTANTGSKGDTELKDITGSKVNTSSADSPGITLAHSQSFKALIDSPVFLTLLTVFLLCTVKNMGFYFPLSDVTGASISLEFTRVFYAAGLIIAGIINDRSRKWGSVCCIAPLVLPFAMLALGSTLNSRDVLWIICYLFFGFYTVYRVIVFADMAGKARELTYLAPLGLMVGRLGDAIGSGLGITLTKYPVVLIATCFIAFMASMFLFINMFSKLYIVAAPSTRTLEEKLLDFQSKYQLSAREMEVLKLVMDGRNNTEIADDLFISYNTVKFHIKNLFKKANCSNRAELIAAINSVK